MKTWTKMKGIRHIGLLLFLVVFACNDDIDRAFEEADGQFVRFFMLVDNGNNVLEYPQVNGGLVPVSEYTKDQLGTLKIPVALSATNFENPIEVDFSTELSDGLQGITIQPRNSLSFTATQLIDTIYVSFETSWNDLNTPSMTFALTEVNNPDIQLGMPNSNLPNDELIINLEDVEFNYTLQNSLEDIVGFQDEEVMIDIGFPNGFFEEDVNTLELLAQISSDNTTASTINYTLELESIDEANRLVTYKYTVNEDLNPELLYETKFQLADIPGYEVSGITEITIRKPIEIPRDNSVNTASQFYDLNDSFYRTYGENWMDFNNDGICSWQAFNAFTYPVVVNANHPNAVQFSGMDTPNDTSDDIYHHAFRIGFDSPIAGNTTNSFNLKRWFNNESTSVANSPGFNIVEALEFFPTSGNSTTDGFVQVISQDIVIAGTNGNNYTIAISGSGVYQEISAGVFEIDLELQATNQALFGGTRIAKYKIYNTNSFDDPTDLSESCFVPTSL